MKYSQVKELCKLSGFKPTELELDDWLILTDSEADIQCAEQQAELLWAFNPSFLSGCTGIDQSVFEAIQANDKCEDNSPAILSIIEATCGIATLVESAIRVDGRGHTLSGYDGEELYLGGDLYAYRTN